VLFAGDTGKKVMQEQTPEGYYKKAILVFGEYNGSFSAFEPGLKELLANSRTTYKQISVCGYSSGGQAALRNYNKANHRVGLIDPTILESDLKKLDAKAILSVSEIPGNWHAAVAAGRKAALRKGSSKAGIVEKTRIPHGKYPGEFLRAHEGNLI
jgi:hypothetical protein